MSTTEEAATAAEPVSGDSAAAAAAEAAPAEPNTAEEKPKKEKKPRTKKPKPKPKKSSTPSHPPYFQMIKDAILALDDKTGSSTYAIAKHIEEKHSEVLPPNYKKVLAVQLKNFTAKGKLVKVRASFKLAEAEKGEEDAEHMTRKPRRASAAAAAAAAAGGSKRKAAALATGEAEKRASLRPSRAAKKTKKKAAALKPKPKPKQPKSIKSRGGSAVAKKAKKVASA